MYINARELTLKEFKGYKGYIIWNLCAKTIHEASPLIKLNFG